MGLICFHVNEKRRILYPLLDYDPLASCIQKISQDLIEIYGTIMKVMLNTRALCGFFEVDVCVCVCVHTFSHTVSSVRRRGNAVLAVGVGGFDGDITITGRALRPCECRLG